MIKIVIKCPAVKAPGFKDFECEASEDWTIAHVKHHLHTYHPFKPVPEDQRLVINGRIPKEFIKLYDLFFSPESLPPDSSKDLLVIHMVLKSGVYGTPQDLSETSKKMSLKDDEAILYSANFRHTVSHKNEKALLGIQSSTSFSRCLSSTSLESQTGLANLPQSFDNNESRCTRIFENLNSELNSNSDKLLKCGGESAQTPTELGLNFERLDSAENSVEPPKKDWEASINLNKLYKCSHKIEHADQPLKINSTSPNGLNQPASPPLSIGIRDESGNLINKNMTGALLFDGCRYFVIREKPLIYNGSAVNPASILQVARGDSVRDPNNQILGNGGADLNLTDNQQEIPNNMPSSMVAANSQTSSYIRLIAFLSRFWERVYDELPGVMRLGFVGLILVQAMQASGGDPFRMCLLIISLALALLYQLGIVALNAPTRLSVFLGMLF